MGRISLDEAKKDFMTARGFMMAARDDRNDSVSANFARAMHEYFTSVASGQVETAKAIDDLSDRISKIETKLNR